MFVRLISVVRAYLCVGKCTLPIKGTTTCFNNYRFVEKSCKGKILSVQQVLNLSQDLQIKSKTVTVCVFTIQLETLIQS